MREYARERWNGCSGSQFLDAGSADPNGPIPGRSNPCGTRSIVTRNDTKETGGPQTAVSVEEACVWGRSPELFFGEDKGFIGGQMVIWFWARPAGETMSLITS